MADDLIPEDLKVFLLRRIDSIAQLEALLLLRANPELDWSAEALAKRLYITAQETAGLLDSLCTDGFLIAQGGRPLCYRYNPTSSELAHMVDRVAEIYARYLIPVTHLIHSKPRTRVQEFADAFKLRKDT